MSIIAQAPASGAPAFDPETFAHEVVFNIDSADWYMHELMVRVTALEEVLAAPWPRRLILAARLGRQLRRSVAPYTWAGPAFLARRVEALANDALAGGR